MVVAASRSGKIERNPKKASTDALRPEMWRRQPSSMSTSTSMLTCFARTFITRSLVVHGISAHSSSLGDYPVGQIPIDRFASGGDQRVIRPTERPAPEEPVVGRQR